MARKKKESVKEEASSTARRELTPEEQALTEEQERQQRVAECTNVVREALQKYGCDLDVTMILRTGQVIPRVSIVPLEVLQAQNAPQAQ